MMKIFNREDGFTLVELMVVVAIIGLLSSVAIPNFKKYQAKAKIAEARLHLSAIYTAESGFFSDYNMYAQCLRYMGYDPDLERPNRYYATGMFSFISTRSSVAHTTALASGLEVTSCPNGGSAVNGTNNTTASATFFYAGKGVGSAIMNGSSLNPTGNQAGTVGTCAKNADGSVGMPPFAGGACVGTQEDDSRAVFLAGAIGVISSSGATAATASGLTIDSSKRLKVLVRGY